jgi:hypothetical protein
LRLGRDRLRRIGSRDEREQRDQGQAGADCDGAAGRNPKPALDLARRSAADEQGRRGPAPREADFDSGHPNGCCRRRYAPVLIDSAADDATYAGLISRQALADDGTVPEAVQRHLIRDVGPAAAAAGGDMFLVAAAAARLSRGASATGELQG